MRADQSENGEFSFSESKQSEKEEKSSRKRNNKVPEIGSEASSEAREIRALDVTFGNGKRERKATKVNGFLRRRK